ncbi:MAG: ATP-binding protein [Spirochaetota bacterium]
MKPVTAGQAVAEQAADQGGDRPEASASTLPGKSGQQWLFLSLGLVILGSIFAFDLLSEADSTWSRETERLATQAKVVGANIAVQLEAVNRALESAIEMINSAGDEYGSTSFNLRLATMVSAMPGVSNFLVIDAKGYCVSANNPAFIKLNFSKRGYFTTPQAQPDPSTLFISAPFITTQKTMSLAVSRMIRGPDGGFGGVIVAGLDPGYFGPLIDSVRYSEDMVTALVHGDGRLFLVKPEQAGTPGAELPPALSAPAGVRTGPRLAERFAIQPEDLRMDKPLLVLASRDRSSIFAKLYQETAIRLGIFAFVALAAIWGMLRFQRRQEKLDAAKAALASNRESNRLFLQNLIDSIPGMVGYWSADLRCVFANSEYKSWFSAAREGMTGIHMRELMGEELFRKNEPFILRALAGEAQGFERTITKPDGQAGHVWAQYIPNLHDGNTRGIFALVSDVTELKRAGLKLEEANRQLEEKVQRRTAELRIALEGAETSNRAKSAFLSRMGHELYTPMNSIMGFAQILESGLPVQLNEEQRDCVEEILKAGRLLVVQLDEILGYSGLGIEMSRFAVTAFDCGSFARDCAQSMTDQLSVGGIELRFELKEDCQVIADRERLRRVLLELLSNAVKFNHEGGWITLGCGQAGPGRTAITVEDSGAGIPESFLEVIFEPFGTPELELKAHRGIGVGLATCKLLVEEMHGSISVTSREGFGSEFRIELPAAKGEY